LCLFTVQSVVLRICMAFRFFMFLVHKFCALNPHHQHLFAMKMKTTIYLLAFIFLSYFATAQSPEISKVEPSNWWIGMQNPEVQIMVHGKDIGKATVSAKYKKVKITKVEKAESPNYLFVTLAISDKASAGKVPLTFTIGDKSTTYEYEIQARSTDAKRIQGFDNSDIIYLLMPDRFANGDPNNDSVDEMLEKADRKELQSRHGGDIKGISDHLDYIHDLGATTLWINPLLENNNQAYSYHGYAITDLYKTDPRFGTNEDYLNLCNKAQQKDMKVIMDMVFNHIGINHWMMADLPFNDWVHQHEEFTRSNFRATTIADPYASKYDKDKMLKGWFDTSMPDLNQQNPFVAKYLTQNSIWWIEYLGLDGIRMDTYPYPYKEFMAEWAKTIMTEYPQFNIVGETWVQEAGIEAYWQKDVLLNGYQSNLPSVTDFIMRNAIADAFHQNESWTEGMANLYYVLAQDFLYKNPYNLVTFADNHDLTRIYTQMGEDYAKYKMAMAFLMTMRGIPQIYYGTEILMSGDGSNHGLVRKDFPGGWQGDERSAFTKEGRTDKENEAFSFLQTLIQYRKSTTALQTGKLMQFVPDEGIYIYFRYDNEQTVMVILNNNKEGESKFTTERYAECIKDFTQGKDILSGESVSLKEITISAKSVMVLELGK